MASEDEEALNTLQKFTENLEYKEKYASKNRFGLLIVHSLIGLAVGSNILEYGPPTSFMGIDVAKGSGLILGGLPFMGGLILLAGLLMRRLLLLEGVGMTCLLIWDAWMAIGFYDAFKDGTLSNPYPIYIYAGLFSFMTIHLWTFYKFLDGLIDGAC